MNFKFQAPRSAILDLRTSKPDHDGLMLSTMHMRFVIEAKHCAGRTLEISCKSSFPGNNFQIINKTIPMNYQTAEVINNQKYYWNNSANNSHTTFDYSWIIFLAVVRWIFSNY